MNWIKAEMQKVMDIWKSNNIKKLKEYIVNFGGEYIDMVLILNKNNWRMFNEINDEKYINDKVIDWLFYAEGMFSWYDDEYTNAEELEEYVHDKIYCSIYEKIINQENEKDQKINEPKEKIKQQGEYIDFDTLTGEQKECVFQNKDFINNSYITKQGTIFVDKNFIDMTGALIFY